MFFLELQNQEADGTGFASLIHMRFRTYNQRESSEIRKVILTSAFFVTTLFLGWPNNYAEKGQGQSLAKASTVAAFEERMKEYIKLRDKLADKLPKLSDKSTPEDIEANFVSLRTSIISARTGAKQGEIFAPDIAVYLRSLIKQEFQGERLKQLRETVREADTKGVPLRVNVPYPETKELIEMPPTLLLKLPKLPKQLHYRFVGRSMLLLDKEARLIVDYMPQALP